MTMLTKIGNSQGIRIPKALIKEAQLENVEIDLEVVENGLLLKPVKKTAREDWGKSIKKVIEKNKNKKDDGILEDFLNDSDLEDYEW
ncbi:AbrB/MazE/SpoVT family DNA-binding domain-containing protein [Arcobacter defluvii]|uniref:Toxin-antitoxin system, antitoxin component, MazE family n=1 Tax=Arcobacter defluvii TaxID=873191 RepID=A0AAE7E7I4_9BACT|nr:AbrB/MazE/SpoVT family DNA-binding domain-containing protein [Arcobacter defluvii]QKF78111.1 toxin-antitoxin system, antitoxin component, MazE family [Arcobacter defluvii]RXI33221.1 AbrB/MazE/SpoVT family DNA-binding domain-containing protein [Arcobacter defluvii]